MKKTAKKQLNENASACKGCSCGGELANDPKLKKLFAFIDEQMKKEYPKSYLIACLHKAQELYGYLEKPIMEQVALRMDIPISQVWGVATFYHFFNLVPQGKHTISVCMGTACYVKGAGKILDALKNELGIPVGQTTKDGLFTLKEARCLGSCAIAPVVMVGDRVYGELDSDKILKVIRDIRKEEESASA